MKSILKSGIALFLLLNVPYAAVAQKIAHVNLDSLLAMMPESKDAKQKGADYYKQLENTVLSMQTELKSKYEAYQQEQGKLTELLKQTKEKELQDLNQRIQDFQVSAQQDLSKKNDELTKPIFEKAKKAIEAVAKENGYKYVLDSGAGMVLFSEPGDDILSLVKKKLNITPTAPSTAEPKAVEPKKSK